MYKIDENYVKKRIINYMENKVDGNWHAEKTVAADLHQHGVDIKLIGGKRNSEYFFIECKGKSYAKSAKSVNKEGWQNALGQIVTRMNTKRYYNSKNGGKEINRAYKYGLGLYWQSAQVALRRIPKEIAQVLNLYIFSVNDKGEVKCFSPSKFKDTEYPDDVFK